MPRGSRISSLSCGITALSSATNPSSHRLCSDTRRAAADLPPAVLFASAQVGSCWWLRSGIMLCSINAKMMESSSAKGSPGRPYIAWMCDTRPAASVGVRRDQGELL